MHRYKTIDKIGEGTFSDVLKIQSLKDGNYYASKKMKQHFNSIEQVNNLREVQALRRLNPHPNILQLQEVIFDKKTGCLALIFELMDKNIYDLIRDRRHPLPENMIKNYMLQLCESLEHIHRNGIFHRDVKPENILIKHDILKLGDFGSSRSVYSKQPYTEYISTRWYRAPECLLTDGYYDSKMDMWSAGCVFFEITSLQPLFPGNNELDQISRIHEIVGTPTRSTLNKFKQSRAMNFDFPYKKGSGIALRIPTISPDSLSLMYALLEYDPDERMTAKQALQHSYFRGLRPLERNIFSMHRKPGSVDNAGTSASMNHLLRIAKQGRRQPPVFVCDVFKTQTEHASALREMLPLALNFEATYALILHIKAPSLNRACINIVKVEPLLVRLAGFATLTSRETSVQSSTSVQPSHQKEMQKYTFNVPVTRHMQYHAKHLF